MRRKVLIVEDSELNRKMLHNILEREYEVIEAVNGKEAIAILHMKHKLISAVILDIVMPVMDGFAVLSQMRSNAVLAQIPVIVATGMTEEDAEVKALAYGANDFVTKPYNPALLLHCLRNTINLRETASIINAIQLDKMTGLYNRETFFAKVEAMLKEHEPGYYIMACFDIDNFKVINDQYGANEGDRILQHIGNVARAGFASIDGIGSRISADNFAALYPAGDKQTEFVNTMRERDFVVPETRTSITYSVGRYLVNDLTLTASAVYDRAYIAKQSVKGRYDEHIAYFSESMREKLIRDQEIISDMDAAIALKQFEVWLQPQFNHSSGAMIGAEALVRWRHPRKGLIPPNSFIPVFEQNGFIYELDKYVWEQVCLLLKKWLDEGRDPAPVSVNISRYDILRDDFFNTVTGLIEAICIPVDLLRLEITESAFAQSTKQIINIVRSLTEYGFTVEIDDFGSAYSSLNTLKDVPATVLKLDMRFFEDASSSQRSGNIVESVVRMAKWLGMSVVAEGVETVEQANYLKSIGCYYVQGYLYSKPMPVEEYEALTSGAFSEKWRTSLETVENLDNNRFWDPQSMDTLIFNGYVGGACIFEYHDGTIELLRANDKYAQVLGSAGITIEDALNLDWTEHLDIRDRLAVKEALQTSIETGTSVTGEYVFHNLPGCPEETYLRSTMRVIASSDDRYLVYCTNENTTAQRQAEKKEHETAEHLRLIMENVNGGVTATIMKNGVPDILFANEQFYRQFGYTKEQFEQEVVNPHDIIHPDDREWVLSQTEAAVRSKQSLTYIYRVVRRDGAVRWLQNKMSITTFADVKEAVQLCILTDITAEKDAERKLYETDEQLRFLNDTAHSLLAQPGSGQGIECVLEKLRAYFGGDRAYIFETNRDGETTSNTYEVCAEGVTPEKENLQEVPADICQFWLSAFEMCSYMDIADVNALGDDRAEEKQILLSQGIHSLIAVPLQRDGALIGYMGIDNPRRQHAQVDRLIAIGDYISVMLTHRDMDAKILSDNENLLGLMNDTPGGFVRIRVYPDGRVTPIYFNDGFCKLVGMTYDELMTMYGNDAMAGVHPEDVDLVRSAVNSMLINGEARSSKYRLRKGDGGYIWLMIFGRMTRNESGEKFLNVYYTDASGQSNLDEQRCELLDNLPCGAGIYEVYDNGIRASYLNKRYREYFKRSISGLSNISAFEAVHPDDRGRMREALNMAVANGSDETCDVRIKDSDGKYAPFRLAGRTIDTSGDKRSVYVTFTPISSDELSYSRMLPVALAAVIGSSNDLAFVKDRSLRYVCCSDAFVQAFGLTDEKDVIGKTDYDLVSKAYADRYYAEDEAVLKTRQARLNYEEAIPDANGSVRYASTSKYPLLDAENNVIGIYGVTRDVTRNRETDSQLSLLADSIPGGLATYVYSPDGIRLTYFNDGYCALFGCDRDEYKRQSTINPVGNVFDEDLPTLLQLIDALRRDDSPMECVYRVHVKGGGYKWISHRAVATDRHGDTIIVNAVLLDITERQEAVERLRISEEEHRLAIKNSGDVICKYNIADRTLSMSPEMANELSLPSKVANVPYELVRLGRISSESVETYIKFFESICHGDKEGSATFQYLAPNGWRWLEAHYSNIFAGTNTPVSAVILLCDITEHLEKETVYRKWQQSLEERDSKSYTLFRCNLSKNASFDTMEGSLLNFDFSEDALSFNERTEEYASQRVSEEDRDTYVVLLNSGNLLVDYNNGKRSARLEYRELKPDGGVRWLRLSIDLVEYPSSTDVEAYLMYEDIDAEKCAELLRMRLAETDPLTGILNRAAFVSRVENTIHESAPNARHALLMLDLDGFKQVNDVFGHGAGDQTLIDTSNSMRMALGPNDLICRLGGDEFMAFIKDMPGDAAVAEKAKRVCAMVRKAFSVEVQITGSVGTVVYPRDGKDFDTLYKNADSALYYVKGSGKDGYAFYREDMNGEHLKPDIESGSDYSHGVKKRRMLIVDNNCMDYELLANMFKDKFIIEKALDGSTALIRLRHYGSAISIVLLDLLMPGMDGFEVLEKMQSSAELGAIPVIVVSGDESRDVGLRAIRAGASDFITKPVDPELLSIRVSAAISRAENERLRAQNRLLELQSEGLAKYRTVLERTGTVLIEYDWINGTFSYDPSISEFVAGLWDGRGFWRILLTDMITDVQTVKKMQELIRAVAEDRERMSGDMVALLKTPSGARHWFSMNVYKQANEFRLTDKLVITFNDINGLSESAE